MVLDRVRAGAILLFAAFQVAACTNPFMPASGPESWDIKYAPLFRTEGLPFGLVRVTPETVDVLAQANPFISVVFPDQSPPNIIKFGIGDVVSVTIFEAAAGGLFIPIEAGVRPGNFINLPNQNVDTNGNISVPYAGTILAKDRTPVEVQQEIVAKLRNRAIEPQAVVALITQNTSLISVLGDVNNPTRLPANAAGEHILDAITRAGGPKSQGYDTWVMLERKKKRAMAPFGALVYEPDNNIWVHPGDTIYLYKEPQTFVALGAFANQGGLTSTVAGPYPFEAWRLSLAEAVSKAGGLVDSQADPASVFIYRGEVREVAERFGIDCSKFDGPIIPVIYLINLRDPAGYFLAQKFQMRNKDVLFAANAASVEVGKVLTFMRLVTATINDPIVAATNAFVLRNTANTRISTQRR